MKINRKICEKVKCKWFAKGHRRTIKEKILMVFNNIKDKKPQIPNTGLCSYTHWIVQDGYFDDESEVPPVCPYSAEIAVSQ